SPYQIQLICHYLFKRVQEKRSTTMHINLSVLEDVRKELESTQDITKRPILQKIRNLTPEHLKAIGVLCKYKTETSFKDIWALEYILNDEKNWGEKSLKNELDYLVSTGIVKYENDLVEFNGDDFDKIYTKYYAIEQDIFAAIAFISLNDEYNFRLYLLINKFKKNLELIGGIGPDSLDVDIVEAINKFKDKNYSYDFLVEFPRSIAVNLYFLSLKNRNREEITIIEIMSRLPWGVVLKKYCSFNSNDAQSLEKFRLEFEDLKNRLVEVNGDFSIKKEKIALPPFELLKEKLINTENEALRNQIISQHFRLMSREYTSNKKEEALFNARFLYDIDIYPVEDCRNNLGYFFLSIEDLEKARKLFESVISRRKTLTRNKDLGVVALSHYNLGIIEMKCGYFDKALKEFENSLDILKEINQEAICLFVPIIAKGELRIEEKIEEMNLQEIVEEAKKKLKLYLNKQ
ncbi:MAG: tetratricopeptide repeat protein, partial [Actinobacteria bacterium]|nr:tetratricopeptide repeat protein [Actinomycetota bacterium]